MANNLAIGMVIGATLASSFKSSFSSASKSLQNLKEAVSKTQAQHQKLGSKLTELRSKQAKLYAEMSKDSRNGGANLAKMKQEYSKIGQEITKVKAQQAQYTKMIEKSLTAQQKLAKAVTYQEKNNQFRENQKSNFSSYLMKGTAVSAVGGSVIKTFMEQEDAANNLKIAMMKADGSYGKFNEIGKIADKLGTDLPGTKKDFYKLAMALKKQGVSDDVLTKGALKTSAELNVLLEMDQESGGEFLAKFMESHRLNENELPKAADYLQRAMFAGGLSKDQMYESMKYYAPKLNSMKLTGAENTEKVLAIEAMAGQQGLEGSTFGTGLNMMLSRMNKGPEMLRAAKKGMKAEARDMVEAVGVEFDFWNKDGSFKGIDGMLAEMQKFEKIRAKYGDKGVGLVAEELFGIEGGRLADILAQKGNKGLDEMLQKMREQASLQDRIKQKTATLGAALESLGGVWETAVGEIGSLFADDIKRLAKYLQGVIEKYTPFIKQHKDIIKNVAGAVAGFLAFKLAVSGLSIVFSAAISPFLAVNTAFRKLQAGIAFFKLTNAAGEVTRFGRALKTLQNAAGKVGGWIGQVSKRFAKFGAEGLTKGWRAIISMSKTLSASIGRVSKVVGQAGRAFAKLSLRAIAASWQGLLSLGQMLGSGLTWIASKAVALGRLFGGYLVQAISLLGRAFMIAGRAMLMNPIGLIITGIALAVYAIYANWDTLAPYFQAAWGWVKQIFSAAWAWIKGVWAGSCQWFTSLWNGLTAFFSQLWTTIKGLFSGAWEWIKSVWGGASAWFSGIWNTIKSTAAGMFDGIKAKVGEAIAGIKSFLGFGGAVDNMGAKINKAGAATAPKVEHKWVGGLVGNGVGVRGFASGGFTGIGGKYEPMGIVHGGEYVMTKEATSRLGVGLLDRLNYGNLTTLETSVKPHLNGGKRGIFSDYEPINRQTASQQSQGGIVVNFNPTINISGGESQGADTKSQVLQAMQMTAYEFEKLLNRVLDQRQRRAY